MALMFAVISAVAFSGLMLSLFLWDKMETQNSAKRMTLVGIVIPVGFTLTMAWVALPLYALGQSLLLAIPAMPSIAIITLVLRGLSLWICRSESLASGGLDSGSSAC